MRSVALIVVLLLLSCDRRGEVEDRSLVNVLNGAEEISVGDVFVSTDGKTEFILLQVDGDRYWLTGSKSDSVTKLSAVGDDGGGSQELDIRVDRHEELFRMLAAMDNREMNMFLSKYSTFATE